MGRPKRTESERLEELGIRFWAQVNKTDGCWFWTGPTVKGYGHIWERAPRAERKKWRAPRLAYTLVYGPIPDGMDVLHHCDTPLCVRPDHFFLGTNIDNIEDRMSKGRGYKLDSETVKLIKKTPGKLVDLARQFGVSHGMIGHIRHGRSWKGVQ
jgi:hypothetical protein